jgi:hypothetical protein
MSVFSFLTTTNVLHFQFFPTRHVMVTPIKTGNWSTKLGGFDTNFSISLTNEKQIAIVTINQARGIGSVFDASVDGVDCLVGTQHDGLEEALARAICQILGVTRTILTIALCDYSPSSLKAALGEIRKFQ